MRYIRIPADESLPWYIERISLDGTLYNLEFDYNTRMDRWFLSIYDAAQTPVLLGIPLLIDRQLTAQYPTLRLPPGPLFVKDQSEQDLQPTLSSFLTDHILVYGEVG